jgi:hypothetical protein
LLNISLLLKLFVVSKRIILMNLMKRKAKMYSSEVSLAPLSKNLPFIHIFVYCYYKF